MAEIVEAVNSVKETWHLRGFISPDGHQVGESIHGYPVLGTIEVLRDYPDAAVVPHNEGTERNNVPRHRLVSSDSYGYVHRKIRLRRGILRRRWSSS